jgi:hypothetical protein
LRKGQNVIADRSRGGGVSGNELSFATCYDFFLVACDIKPPSMSQEIVHILPQPIQKLPTGYVK